MLTALACALLSGLFVILFAKHVAAAFSSRAPRFISECFGLRTTAIATGTCAILGAFYFWQVGTQCSYIDSREIGVVEPASRAALAGFQAGDEILSINGEAFYGWGAQLMLAPDYIKQRQVSEFLVSRPHEKVTLHFAVRENEAAPELGIYQKQSHLLLTYPEAVATSLRVIASGVQTAMLGAVGGETASMYLPLHPMDFAGRGMFLGFIASITLGVIITSLFGLLACARFIRKAYLFTKTGAVLADAH
ncbi:MAG: hypothetical protein K1X79_13155, partial [Oligoflexia bacterium]|nr:hypothetical protein [Oligoflexia bacterium]